VHVVKDECKTIQHCRMSVGKPRPLIPTAQCLNLYLITVMTRRVLRYTAGEKLEIVAYAKCQGINNAAKVYGVGRKSVCEWIKNKDRLMLTPQESFRMISLKDLEANTKSPTYRYKEQIQTNFAGGKLNHSRNASTRDVETNLLAEFDGQDDALVDLDHDVPVALTAIVALGEFKDISANAEHSQQQVMPEIVSEISISVTGEIDNSNDFGGIDFDGSHHGNSLTNQMAKGYKRDNLEIAAFKDSLSELLKSVKQSYKEMLAIHCQLTGIRNSQLAKELFIKLVGKFKSQCATFPGIVSPLLHLIQDEILMRNVNNSKKKVVNMVQMLNVIMAVKRAHQWEYSSGKLLLSVSQQLLDAVQEGYNDASVALVTSKHFK
jgi:hypothetical protein